MSSRHDDPLTATLHCQHFGFVFKELEIPETSLIDRLFQKHRGPDGQVDASSLQKILAEAKLESG